jgi:hypothetical protein
MSPVPKKPAQSTPDYEHCFRDSAPATPRKGSSLSAPNSFPRVIEQEPYVDAQCVAEHLSLSRREVLKLTRARKLPAHPIDPCAVRKIYRYRLSEIDDLLSQTLMTEEALGFTIASRDNDHRQPRDQRG